MKKGPDLSKWNGVVDFPKLKTAVDFVILRSTYGLQSVDNKFYEYAAAAKRVGLPILGVYHFCYATSVQQAENEAMHCIATIERAGLEKDTIVFYDLEYDSVEKAKKKGVVIDKRACIAYTVAFCHKVQQLGYRAGVYFNKDYYKNMYDESSLAPYIKWLAEYGKSTPTYSCDVQQVSSTEKVIGVVGNTDWNFLWNDDLLKKEEEEMTDEQFYQKFCSAMEEYRLRLRMKEPGGWSEPAREFCIERGLFSGDGEGNFQWNDFLTREQAAQLVYNAYHKGAFRDQTEKVEE